MKRTAICLAILFYFSHAHAQSGTCSITGDLSNLKFPVEKVYLYYESGDGRKQDSTIAKNGKYHFEVKLDDPSFAMIRAVRKPGAAKAEDLCDDSLKIYMDQVHAGKIKEVPIDFYKRVVALSDSYRCRLFLEASAMTVTHHTAFSSFTVTGSHWQDEFTKLINDMHAFRDKCITPEYDSLDHYLAIGDSADYKRASDLGERMTKEMNKTIYLDFVEKHPSSPVSLFALTQASGFPFDVDLVQPYYDKLDASLKNMSAGKSVGKSISAALKTAIGKPEIDFTMNDTSGHPIALSSFKGKYVLLDFWASWCGPCREENPNVVKIYSQYKNKGFEILSVSLDNADGKSAWLKAIHDDTLTWTHVADLKSWSNEAAVLYNIQGIPDNFLINPAGTIVARGLRGDDLKAKLEEVLK